MPIILFILWLAIIGVVTWAVVTYIPMPDAIKKLIIIVVVVLVVLWLVQLVGVLGSGPTIPRLGGR